MSLAALAKACPQEKSLSRSRMAEIVFNLTVLAQTSSEASHKPPSDSAVDVESIAPVITPISAR